MWGISVAGIYAFIASHRKKIEIGVALLVAALAIGALNHLLAELSWVHVRAAIADIGPARIGIAIALTAASYILLTFYDVLALHVIGRPLPYRSAALASFTSYTLSHNLGLALLTGGSARFRVYNQAGLSAGEIARVILLAGLSFWLGVTVLGGAALAWTGGAQTNLPISGSLAQYIGIAVVLSVIAIIVWCGRQGRTLRIWSWRLPLPPARIAIAQVLVSAADLAVTSAALFVLLSDIAPSLFLPLFLAYILAIIISLVSHVPGGLGIFESVMLAMLPEVGRPELFAALLVFRAVYYLLPLLLAVALLAFSERKRWTPLASAAGRGLRAVSFGIIPQTMAALTFGGGLVLLLSGSLPALPHRLAALRHIIPLPFAETSQIAASLVGTALILIAPGLYRRQEAACLVARGLMMAGAIFSLTKGLDYEEAAILTSLAIMLHLSRGAFYRHSLLVRRPLTTEWILAVTLAFGISVWLGFFAYRDVVYSDELWWQFAWHSNAPRFLRTSFAVGLFLVIAALWRLFQPASKTPVAAGGITEPPKAAFAHTERTEAYLALTGDKRFLVSDAGDAFLMYQVQEQSWIAMGDPVGNPAATPELMWRLRDMADLAQGRVLFYQITAQTIPVAIDMGLQLIKYGEEARINLPEFTLEGPAARALRYSVKRAEREGATFELIDRELVPAIMSDLHEISDTWLSSKKGPEKCFSVGRFDPDYMSQFDCAVVRVEGQIVAFANIWKTEDKSELSVDLMRHGEQQPYGCMDFLMVHIMQWGKANGFRWFTLGLAPLSGIEGRRLSPTWARFGSLLYRHGDAFYGFEGLRDYKEKYSPVWEPRYIAGPRAFGLLRALFDLQRLIGGSRRSAAHGAPLGIAA
ncbi:bifunctional lysylphosphatidylglycerol flippase/synthetase MprF [Altererythrobacter indicus]|uniref:Phosphatidylglycerol lysyltransferase n=1 Tax=Altericroceibacterium indicum TaxID=374177 RepID=A0A845A602_9SPHN|nr:bifunctional lysylphosphatidylglycerol flippase/synthetase MprF [Altericroceibacterium indicum]MXP25124.1 bifunctional lysylphosphatidylglycerol flippase/synthetase MprF [Altericroceibacterium indicum]